ncbi:nst1, partial [Ophiophagus hannah]
MVVQSRLKNLQGWSKPFHLTGRLPLFCDSPLSGSMTIHRSQLVMANSPQSTSCNQITAGQLATANVSQDNSLQHKKRKRKERSEVEKGGETEEREERRQVGERKKGGRKEGVAQFLACRKYESAPEAKAERKKERKNH